MGAAGCCASDAPKQQELSHDPYSEHSQSTSTLNRILTPKEPPKHYAVDFLARESSPKQPSPETEDTTPQEPLKVTQKETYA